MDLLPSTWVPYAELMRINKPAGLCAFFFPYIIGTCYAASVADSPPSLAHFFSLCTLFIAQSLVLRGAACTWNDNVDQEYDRKVARCRSRPIARGAVTSAQANVFTAILTAVWLSLFAFLPLECFYHAFAVAALFAFYPFAKRITYYPQLVLGFPFAWAIFISCAALHIDPFGQQALVPIMGIFAANILWTMIYDTIYAHQDIKDDVKAGVKSMAVRFAESTKPLVSIFAVMQTMLLLMTGLLANLSSIYYVGACGGTGFALACMISSVDLQVPASCAWWFHRGFWLVGGCMVAGLFGHYCSRLAYT